MPLQKIYRLASVTSPLPGVMLLGLPLKGGLQTKVHVDEVPS